MSIETILQKTGPRKLLALDGGGIRGMLTIEVLARIEKLLADVKGVPDLVLADYFDYIAGTSTGAIIATCLALGMPVAKVRDFYRENGPAMFDRAALLEMYRYRFRDDKLADRLKKIFGADTTLGSDRIRTLLMMVLRNATTDSPWPLSNNPRARYSRADHPGCNLKLPLWQLVRASTAAPTFFPPESVRVGTKEFIFVDGGVTMYNNPSFQLFLMATVEPYNLCWPTGEDRMLVVSVGTGTSTAANADLQPSDLNLLYNAGSVPSALMTAALNEQDFLCRVFGKCLAGPQIDREVGNMIGQGGPIAPKLFTYVRYNVELDRAGLEALELDYMNPVDLRKLDSIEHTDDLQEVGRRVGKTQVKASHFQNFPP